MGLVFGPSELVPDRAVPIEVLHNPLAGVYRPTTDTVCTGLEVRCSIH